MPPRRVERRGRFTMKRLAVATEGDHGLSSAAWRRDGCAGGGASTRKSVDLPIGELTTTIANTSWPLARLGRERHTDPMGARGHDPDPVRDRRRDRAARGTLVLRLFWAATSLGPRPDSAHPPSAMGPTSRCDPIGRSARAVSAPMCWYQPSPCRGAETASRPSETPWSRRSEVRGIGPSPESWRFRLRRSVTGCAGHAARLSGFASAPCDWATSSMAACRPHRRGPPPWPRRSMRSDSRHRRRSAAWGGLESPRGESSPS